VSQADAFGPDIDPRGAWFDEMLLSGNRVVVIGYSYARGGTEIALFEISPGGQLAYKATYHLRSNDYYSSRNYASRLIGTKLVFYSPHRLNPWGGDPYAALPAMRRWRPGALPGEFQRIAPATRIYRTDEPLDPFAGVALHSVSVCDVAKPELECESTAVLGPPGACSTSRRARSSSGPQPGGAARRLPRRPRRCSASRSTARRRAR
jgi:hypothetical protein